MTIFLTKEEIVAAHCYMIRKMNDADQAGIKDHALLDSAVHKPEQSLFGEDAYPSLFEKAAALLESLVKNHSFHNGNKRTAYLAVKSFLMVNGYHLKMVRLFAVEFIVDIAKDGYSFEQIASILREHSVRK
ncbi:death on curing protein [Paenibacillus sophorae]|uniref:Death on curing protein n=1 Tax=Paenibacillus sophorae TaxID=1333845 RepID=A0A1H8P722_9BACL|nr:type II toxin-antitoxin system death-on-curing family toxin [Paenibacillus sophorae]QWU16458.1 type II toxin-antitoxin system death-on-curing family toxin [Paenibacillus sophorae]SEO37534.1 death on curing protein [Paenibacillus sophorae]